MGGEPTPVDPATLVYRPLDQARELGAVVRLFDLAGWGPVTEADVRSWVADDPEGPWLVMGAVHEPGGEVLGIAMYSPHRVQFLDRVGRAGRARSVVLDPRVRRAERGVVTVDEGDPLRRMIVASRPERTRHGWELVFSLPNPKMVRRSELRTYPDDTSGSRVTLGNGLRLDLRHGATANGRVAPADDPPGPEYDDLWPAAREGLGIECAVVRDASSVARRPGLRLELRAPGTGHLLGYTVFSDDAGGKLEDLLAVDAAALEELLVGSLGWLRANPGAHDLEFANSTPHPVYGEHLRAVGATEIDWLFAFSVTAFPPREAPELDASRWYVTVGD
ncbi:MAG: hypothetical protein ACKOBG_08255 [Actinomycetota bacterium]